MDLQEYLHSLPEWNDEMRVAGLFSAFGESREVNPQVWDSRMIFWKQVLTQSAKLSLLSEDSLLFHISKEFESKFMRNGLTPLGIRRVLYEMYKNNEISIQDDFSKAYSHLSWLFNNLIKRPLKWSLSQLSPVSEQESANALTGSFVIHELVEDLAKKVMLRCSKLEGLDRVITMQEFHRIIQDVWLCSHRLSPRDLNCVVTFLQCRNFLTVSSTSTPFVKIGSDAITETDSQVAVILETLCNLNKQSDEISAKISEVQISIKKCLEEKQKQMAMVHLKRRKALEVVQVKRSTTFHSLEEVLLKIKTSSMDATVINVFSIANSALKKVLNDNSLTVEKVETVLDSLSDTLADHQEIEQAMMAGQSEITGGELEEFEQELEQLMEDEKSKAEEQIQDLLKELDDLKLSPLPSLVSSDQDAELEQKHKTSIPI